MSFCTIFRSVFAHPLFLLKTPPNIQNITSRTSACLKKIFAIDLMQFSTHTKRHPAKEKSFKQIQSTPSFKKEDRELTFEEFKQTHIKSFADYKNSAAVKYLFKGNEDPEALEKAYEDYCRSYYSLYKAFRYGGNPSRMI